MGTYYMLFPFLTCEAKGDGSAGLGIADRKNLHSMTLALRGIMEPFRLVGRAEELHRRVLTFSVSHEQEMVRIYGHYPVIEGDKTTYWRYPMRKYGRLWTFGPRAYCLQCLAPADRGLIPCHPSAERSRRKSYYSHHPKAEGNIPGAL